MLKWPWREGSQGSVLTLADAPGQAHLWVVAFRTCGRPGRAPLTPRPLLLQVIYMARNPKDLVVSYYQFHRSLRTMSYRGTFQEFCRRFMNDKRECPPWGLQHPRLGTPGVRGARCPQLPR